jgi:hypothetical protein
VGTIRKKNATPLNRGGGFFYFSGFANGCSIPEDFHFSVFAFGQLELDLAAYFDVRLQGIRQRNAEPVLFCSQKEPRGFGKGYTSARRFRRDSAPSGFFIVTAEDTFHCRAPLHSLTGSRQVRGATLHQTAKSARAHLSELTVKGGLRPMAAQ